MTPAVAVIVAAVGAVASGAFAYLIANRNTSGKIGTSDADALWAESLSIRDDYRQRIAVADARVAALESRVEKLEQLNSDLAHENRELKAKIELLERENEALKQHVEQLEVELRKNGGL